MALPDTAPLPYDIAIEGVAGLRRGQRRRPRRGRPQARASRRDEVEYAIGLPGDGFETEVFFSDLGHEYITINAEYTT